MKTTNYPTVAFGTRKPAFAGSIANSTASLAGKPTFGSAAGLAAGAATGMKSVPVGGFLKAFDFKEMAAANLTQIKLIYGLCILSRIYNASRRSKNEVREVTTRDSMGFTFWFFATPIIQRLFLKTLVPRHLREALVQKAAPPEATAGLRGKLSLLNYKLNPMSRWVIPSSQQIKDQMHQALETMNRSGVDGQLVKGKGMLKLLKGQQAVGEEAYLKVFSYYKNLLKYRNLATGLGWAVTIGLLGIGINMYNIHMTRKKVAAGQIGR